MRVTSVAFADTLKERGGRHAARAAWPAARPPAETKEEAPPVPEPDKGLHFDVRA